MSTKKVYFKNKDVKSWVHNIVRQMDADGWRPDYIVGLTRGGLIPATMMSHYLNVRMETLKVSLRDDCGGGPETNCWMPEDALGYNSVFDGEADVESWRSENRKNILIVDDINDSGHTLKWIQQDWEASVAGVAPAGTWDSIWNNNVRIAVCINNDASEFKDVDYTALTINKMEDPVWIVFPWENWWE